MSVNRPQNEPIAYTSNPNNAQGNPNIRSPSYGNEHEPQGPSQSIYMNEDPSNKKKQKVTTKKGSNFNQ